MTVLEAIRTLLEASEDERRAALARLGGQVEAIDRTWPPDRIDRDDPYWEWTTLDDAAAGRKFYGRTKLERGRYKWSLPASNEPRAPRWYSLRRIRELYGAS